MTPFDPDRPCILVHARGSMIPMETTFWEAVRREARTLGREVILTGHHWPQQPMDVPLLRARSGLDAVRHPGPSDGWRAWMPLRQLLDEETLLARERVWRGPERGADHLERRRRALYFYHDFYHYALEVANPKLTVIWNGQHPQEMILDQLARARGSAVWYIERGPFAGTIQVDPDGILGGSSVARNPVVRWNEGTDRDHWLGVAERLLEHLRNEQSTWWEQPESAGSEALRSRLRIPPGRTVVLFTGQVDQDTQNILYSPHFRGGLDAFRWFVARMRKHNGVFVLGKHHPKAKEPASAYRTVVEEAGLGTWVEDVSIQDCLGIADRVAAVNSTSLYEAIVRETPILALGLSLLHGKGVGYEIVDRADSTDACGAWLAARDWSEHLMRWREFVASLLAHDLFALNPNLTTLGVPGPAELASRFATILGPLPATAPAPRRVIFPPIDEVGLWDRERALARR